MKKLVHLADLHLGAHLHDRDRLPEQRLFLDWLCDLLARESPDAFVVAGDIFDVYYPSAGVQGVWLDFLARIREEGLAGSVVAVAGNHDSPSALGCTGRILRLVGTRLLAGDTDETAEAFLVPCADGGALAFAAMPFLRDGLLRTEGGGDEAAGFRAHAARALAAARALTPEAPLVAVAHCTLAGATLSDLVSERGRGAVGGLKAVGEDSFAGADYVALGHLHVPQAVGGRPRVRYAGSPIPMSAAETGTGKTVAVAEFDGAAGAPVRVRTVGVPAFRDLRVFSGSNDRILADIAAWSPAVRPAGAAWAVVSLTEGEGSFAALCADARDALAKKGAELVCNTDDRAVRAASAADAPLAVADVQALDPLAIAADRLAEPDLHLSEAERAEFVEMLREVLA